MRHMRLLIARNRPDYILFWESRIHFFKKNFYEITNLKNGDYIDEAWVILFLKHIFRE